MDEDAEAYRGRIVILRPSPDGYEVTVSPPLAGHDQTRTYWAKDSAWHYAASLWREHSLPFRDESAGNTGRDARRQRQETNGF